MGQQSSLWHRRIERVHDGFLNASERFDSFRHLAIKKPTGLWSTLTGGVDPHDPTLQHDELLWHWETVAAVDGFWTEVLACSDIAELACAWSLLRDYVPFEFKSATWIGRWATAADDNEGQAARDEFYRLANMLLLEEWGFDIPAMRRRCWFNCDADSWFAIAYREVLPFETRVAGRGLCGGPTIVKETQALIQKILEQSDSGLDDCPDNFELISHPTNFFVVSAKAIERFLEIEWIGPKSPSEWAKRFGTSWKTIKRRIDEGTIRARGDSSKSYWIAECDLPSA